MILERKNLTRFGLLSSFLFLSVLALPSSASADLLPNLKLFFGGDVGLTAVTSGNFGEANKGGYHLAVKGIASLDHGENWFFDAGFGWFHNVQDNSTGTIFEITTNAGFFEGGVFYKLTPRWHFGPVINLAFGTDVSFDQNTSTDDVFAVLGGFRLGHEFDFETWNLRVGGKVLTDITIGGRQFLLGLLDVQFGFPLKKKPVPVYEYSYGDFGPVQVLDDKRVLVTLDDKTVLFKTGQSVVDPSSRHILSTIASYLKDNQANWTSIEVRGHTDIRGDEEKNVTLSFHRASSVAEIFVNQGIAADKVKAKGFGPKEPIDPANNEAAWAKNRRVELRIEGVEDAQTLSSDLKAIWDRNNR